MLREQPDLDNDALIACLRTQYDLDIIAVRFLPIGYDLRAFVYEAVTAQKVSWFVKVRIGAVSPASFLVPHALREKGIPNVLAPYRTRTGALWCPLETATAAYSVTVYPFVRGENAIVAGLSESQWREFGATLQAVHARGLTSLLREQVLTETFAIPSAQLVRDVSVRLADTRFESPAAVDLAAFWNENASRIGEILIRAEALRKQLQSRTFGEVLCHADIHAANILVSSEDGHIYLVDWDGPLIAPRERDLLFIVGSTIARRVEPREEAWFFAGYGAVEIDLPALAYYRYERAIEDLGTMAESVFFDTRQSEAAKAEEAALLRSLFEPGQIIASAREADRN